MSGFSQNMSQMEFSQDGMGGSSALMNLRGAGSVQDTGMLSQDSTYQGDRNPNATDGGFLSQLWRKVIKTKAKSSRQKSKKLEIQKKSGFYEIPPMKHCKRILLKLGFAQTSNKTMVWKQSFFQKNKILEFFVCERFENKKKGLLLMKKATKKGIKTLKSEC